MQNSAMLANIMQRFGNRRSLALRETVLYELNRKIEQREQGDILPWFMEAYWRNTSTPSAVTVAGQNFIELPPNFIREIEEGVFKVLNTNVSPTKWFAMNKVSLEDLEAATESSDPQLPVAYAIFGTQFIFGPTPNAVYQLKLPYSARSLPISDNNDEATNPWIINFYNFITLDTIDLVARTHTKDPQMVQQIGPELQEATDLFWRAVEARQHVNRDYLLDNSES